MRTQVVVQSRLSSTRLPGKAALTLGGRPSVVLCAQRAARGGLPVVVATSSEPEDDVVAAELALWGIDCFRGSLDDPLDRFARATEQLDDGDVVVRLTADNVVPDDHLVREVVGAMGADGYIRVATGMPYGLSVEAFRVDLLRRADREASARHDREHVTPFIRRVTSDAEHTPEGLSDASVPGALRDVRCTMDTLDDYRVAHQALHAVTDPVGVHWRELLESWTHHGHGHDAVTGQRLASGQPNALGQGVWVLGTAQLGMAYGVANTAGEPSSSHTRRLLAAAAAAGVTHLDTARAYGVSEERIGASMRHGLSESVGIVTKIRPLDHYSEDADGETLALAAELSMEQSLRALGVPSVDAVLVHRWSDWTRGDGAVGERLTELVDAGKARVAGASLSTPAELLEALGDERVRYVQVPFNILDRRLLSPEVQAAVRRQDVILSVRSVFLQGLLLMNDGPWPTGTGLDALTVRDGLVAARDELGRTSFADLCLAYVRGHDFVTSVVLGAESEEQVRDQARLLSRPPLSTDEISVVHRLVPSGPPDLVDPSRWRFEQ